MVEVMRNDPFLRNRFCTLFKIDKISWGKPSLIGEQYFSQELIWILDRYKFRCLCVKSFLEPYTHYLCSWYYKGIPLWIQSKIETYGKSNAEGKTFSNKYSGYDTKLHLMVRLQSCSFEVRVPLYCHYSQIHSEPEWSYQLESHMWVQ